MSEPHDLPQEVFLDEVHSFEFWFQAVAGYLTERPHGHDPGIEAVDLEASQREALITTLCNYAVGETAALEASSGMIRFAPNRRAKVFLATQVVDEARHLEVLLHRLSELGVTRLEEAVESRANRRMPLDECSTSDRMRCSLSASARRACFRSVTSRHTTTVPWFWPDGPFRGALLSSK